MNFFRQNSFSRLADAIVQPSHCRKLVIGGLDFNLVDKGDVFLKLLNLKELHILGDYTIYDMANFDLPSTIGRLSKLRILSLLNLPIKEFPSWITGLYNLEYLMVRGTDVAQIPESISELTKLRSLRVENCPLSELPLSLKGMTHLRKLELCDTRLTDLNPDLFPKNLKHLNFSGTGCYNPSDLDLLQKALRKTRIYPTTRNP